MNWKKKFVRNWGRLGMKFNWTTKKLSEIAYINPRESIGKGVVAKKVPMDKLQSFCRDVPEFVFEEYKGGAKFRNDDTIMARITPCLENGKIAKVSIFDNDEIGFGSTEYIVFRAIDGVSDADFLYYLICSPLVRNPAIKSMVGSSGRQRVQTDVVANLDIELPPIEEQRKIGGLLKTFDDKIKLNNEINNNLEQQASTLFSNVLQRSTSVFYVELGALADVKGGKRLPKGISLITVPNQHPYIRVRDLNNTVFASLSNDYEYIDDVTQKSISRYIVTTGDVLISIVGTIGLTAIVDHTLNKANLTENCVKLTNLKKVTPEYLLLFLRSSQGIEAIRKGTVGAVQLKLPIKNIQSIAVPLLRDEELLPLNETLSAIFSQISANIVEMKQLADIRNTLLPRLMSGELDVSEIDL